MRAVTLLALACLLLLGCAEEKGPLEVPQPDRMLFDTQIYPLLLRDCGFHACHGSHERFFQVFGPGHGRLNPLTRPPEPPTPEELLHSYQRARAMIDREKPDESLLLVKPLSIAAGGVGHEGVDEYGREVYESKLDPTFNLLQRWARGELRSGVPSITSNVPMAPGTTP